MIKIEYYTKSYKNWIAFNFWMSTQKIISISPCIQYNWEKIEMTEIRNILVFIWYIKKLRNDLWTALKSKILSYKCYNIIQHKEKLPIHWHKSNESLKFFIMTYELHYNLLCMQQKSTTHSAQWITWRTTDSTSSISII